MPTAGQVIRAFDMTVDEQDGNYDFTNSTFGTAFASGDYADCAVTFIARSTSAKIHFGGRVVSSLSNSGFAYLSVEVRTGGTVGSGDLVAGPSFAHAVMRVGGDGERLVQAGALLPVVGVLAPGATYNARMVHRITSGTGTSGNRWIVAEPIP